jgi:LysM repeat protein
LAYLRFAGLNRKTKHIQMKKSILFLLLACSCLFASAQNELLVQRSEKGLYLSHTVVAGENFYSIGRLFNVSAKEIAGFNGLDMEKGLNIGQEIRIPLTRGNFNQTAAKGRPVYYVVGNGEGLYRVSVNNNKVLMASLRKFNNLTSDQINAGEKLIVGYLVSTQADRISEPSADVASVTPPTDKQTSLPDKKPEATPDRVHAQPQQQEPGQKEEVVAEKLPPPPPAAPQQVAYTDGTGGYFRTHFDQQIRQQPVKHDETASAGIFKTASGWQDAKYYALMDKVEPGTIIRITNPTNNKVVYAKVLGEMSGIRQNQGYDVRISNAAASALEVADTDKFIVRVNF